MPVPHLVRRAQHPRAVPPSPASGRATWSARQRLLALVTALVLTLAPLNLGLVQPSARALALSPDPVPPASGLDTATDQALLDSYTGRLAPGLDLTSFTRLQHRAWVTGHVMTMDTKSKNLSLDLTDGGAVSANNKTVSDYIKDDPQAVAAVNGDFYEMNDSDAPRHTNISASDGIRTLGEPASAFTVTDGMAAIQRLVSASSLTRTADGRKLAIGTLNSPLVSADKAAAFNSAWGTANLKNSVKGDFRFIRIVDSKVVEVADNDRTRIDKPAAIAANELWLIVPGAADANPAAFLQVGDQTSLELRANARPNLAVGGDTTLVENGTPSNKENKVTAGRTAVGISRDGSKIFFVSIDGRKADGDGMTFLELGELLRDLGAWNAINLDGGGSTTLVGRPMGTKSPVMLNRPSDGTQRKVSNALVIRSKAAPAPLSNVSLRLASEPAQSQQARRAKVFPGLQRTLVGQPSDANGAPVAAQGRFEAAGVPMTPIDGNRATISGASTPGTGSVTYSVAGHVDTLPVQTLGRPTRLQPSSSLLGLSAVGEKGNLTINGVDADGNAAPIETSDATVTSTGPITVEPSSPTQFGVTGTKKGAGTITVKVGNLSTTINVTIGTDSVTVDDFSDLSHWKFSSARATGALSNAKGPKGENALGITYDFTKDTATRGAYATATPEIPIKGQPQSIKLWIKGDESGVWPRLNLKLGDGSSTNLDPTETEKYVTWKGWKQVTFPIPAGTAYPVTLTAIRMMEIQPDRQYQGDVTVAGLTAEIPASIDLPEAPYVTDPGIIEQGTVDGRTQRIAVMSDAQFVAREPNSATVTAARQTLREIVAARPDFLFIDGDMVDEAHPEDIALAKKLLDEEVGDKVAYQYVPGNHEVMGGPISNFTSVFGATNTVRDLAGTRFITLTSHTGNLHPGGDLTQLRFLEDQLASAAHDDSVSGVVLLQHHPIDDPLPDKASQLTDRTEAAHLDTLLARFQTTSGKSIANINGHVGAFHASSKDGITRIINGNSGKAPASGAARGGWRGWTMLGIDPARGRTGTHTAIPGDRIGWLQGETHPWVDSLRLAPAKQAVRAETKQAVRAETAPDAEPSALQVAPGSSLDLAASFTQGSTTVPVRWPVSHQWSGQNIRIDGRGRADAPVNFDTATRRLSVPSSARAGTAVLQLMVNGRTALLRITVPAGSTESPSATAAPSNTVTPSAPATPSATPSPTVSMPGTPTPPAPSGTSDPTSTPSTEPGRPLPGTGR